jgi:DNA-binding beta-propeller fold protein YncE
MKPITRKPFVLAFAAALAASLPLVSQAATGSAVPAGFGPHRFASGPQFAGANSLAKIAAAPRVDAATASAKLDYPWGVTIAPNGDLYVANYLGNSILVYGRNLIQKTTSTITNGVHGPTSVAFDSAGEIYVANALSGDITVYDANHNLLANRTLAYYGYTLAFDALDNLYIGGTSTFAIELLRSDGAFELSYTVSAFTTPEMVATSRHFIAYGGISFNQSSGTTAFYTYLTNQLLAAPQGPAPGYAWTPFAYPTAMAFDANEKLYVAGQGGVSVFTPLKNTSVPFAFINFLPYGVAADVTGNHVFVSNATNDSIAVYSTSGKPLGTLH